LPTVKKTENVFSPPDPHNDESRWVAWEAMTIDASHNSFADFSGALLCAVYAVITDHPITAQGVGSS
jgi:hypothetical protein